MRPWGGDCGAARPQPRTAALTALEGGPEARFSPGALQVAAPVPRAGCPPQSVPGRGGAEAALENGSARPHADASVPLQLPYTELEKVSGIEEAKHYLRQKLRELRF